MNRLSRRDFVLTTAGALTAATLGPWVRTARAATFSYKIGTDLPAEHPLNKRIQQATDAIRKETDGGMDIKLFPDSQLGGDPAMFSQLRAGALEFFMVSGANVLSSLAPTAAISGVGFAFKDSNQVYQALDGDLGKLLRDKITKVGLVAQDKIWANGFRQITSGSHPIRVPDDLKGFKIRIPVSKLWTSLFQSLGAAPVGLSSNEIYTALQTKVADGQENALVAIDVHRLNEVQKYCSMTNHMWDGFWLTGNKGAWNRLPSAFQQSVSKHMNAYALLQRKDVSDQNDSLVKALTQKGLVFNSVDSQLFRTRLSSAGFYAQWKRTFGTEEWSMLEQVTGALT